MTSKIPPRWDKMSTSSSPVKVTYRCGHTGDLHYVPVISSLKETLEYFSSILCHSCWTKEACENW